MTDMVIWTQETTSHSWKIKHRWKHVLGIKINHVLKVNLESFLHECIPQVENYPRDQREWISKDLSEAS